MPSKNSIKTYVANGIYHVYNRGVEKRNIFLDDQDYKTFLSYIKASLTTPVDSSKLKINITFKGETFKGIPRQPKNFHGEIKLIAYCLMPNHFHFIIQQNSEHAMKNFIQSVATRFSMYFNKKYKRVGKLFQGVYKALLITEDSHLLHLSRYIHLNPLEYTPNIFEAYSSYIDYLCLRKTNWVNSDVILSYFDENKNILPFLHKINTYKNFVEDYYKSDKNNNSRSDLGILTLED